MPDPKIVEAIFGALAESYCRDPRETQQDANDLLWAHAVTAADVIAEAIEAERRRIMDALDVLDHYDTGLQVEPEQLRAIVMGGD